MTVGEIYRKAIETGAANDWRGQTGVDAILEKARTDADRPGFDKDRLFNPYGDTRIVFGEAKREVGSVLVGIDIGPPDILLARRMREAGKGVDLCLSHHVVCNIARPYFIDDILLTHKYALAEVGVPSDKYNPPVDRWTACVTYDPGPGTVDAAGEADIPLMNIHTPCDLLHIKHTRGVFARMKDAPLADIVAELNEVKEIQTTPGEEVVVHGDAAAKPGKVYNPTGAGWRPLIELFELACQAGIDTAVLVCPQEEYFRAAREYGVNIVELPHNSNDNHGINLMLDELERMAPLVVYETGAFRRIRRR